MISKTTLPKIMLATLLTVQGINAAELVTPESTPTIVSGSPAIQMEQATASTKGFYRSIPAPIAGIVGVTALAEGWWWATSEDNCGLSSLVGVTVAAGVLLFLACDQYQDNPPIKLNAVTRKVAARQAVAARRAAARERKSNMDRRQTLNLLFARMLNNE